MKKLVILLCTLCILLTGCGFASSGYSDYITSILDCTYHAEYTDYQELTHARTADAEKIYQQEKDALTEKILKNYSIRADKISEDTLADYTALAEKILKKTKYQVRDVLPTENHHYIVTLVICPIDFFEKSVPLVETYYYSEFLRKYRKAPSQTAADYLEQEYAEKVLEILNQCADSIDYLESETYSFTVYNSNIAPETWTEIDNLLLNLSTEQTGGNP